MAAATAPADQFGCSSRIRAATPAACGEAIEVPLIHTQRPPFDSTARPVGGEGLPRPVSSVLDQPARIRPNVTPGVWAASPPGAATLTGWPVLE